MTEFYHGPEVVEGSAKKIVIQSADVSIVGIIGTAPIFMLDEQNRKINELVEVSDHQKKAKFLGENLNGFTLFDAVDTVLEESGGAKIYAVNVFDPDKHKSDVTDETKSFIGGKIVFDKLNIQNLSLKQNNVALEESDYEFKDNAITKKEGSKLNLEQDVTLSYSYADPSKVTAADIIGAVDEFDIKTGLKCFEDVESLFNGDEIGILIAPAFEGIASVAKALENIADELDAYTYTAAPIATTKQDAIKGRGTQGTINFQSVAQNRMLLFPYVGRFNQYANEDQLKSLSPVAAGLRVKIDRERGPQKSISSTASKTITRLETPISFRIGKINTDANILNSQGITTVINKNGFRIFGNRSANFPAQSGVKTFECVKRTDLFIKKSILKSTIGVTDEPITTGFINSVCDAINAFMDSLKNPANPIIIDGMAWYDPTLNTPENIANGWVRFCYSFASSTPAERITYIRTIDIQLYKSIGSEAA